jgi:glycosyltransferase involved in cell wall biosynthesis
MNDVDVLIPVHGSPIYLAETLKSVVNQKYINRIYLILDRVEMNIFSKIDIINKYDNIEILVSKKPGIVEALNLGLLNSKAKYIARIDSDDLMTENRIKIQRDYMEENRSCICSGSYLEVFGDNQKKYIKKYPTHFKAIKHRMEYQNSIAHPSVMYLADKAKHVGGYRNLFEGSEDYDLWFRLSKEGEIRNINLPLTMYRKSLGQYSMKFSGYRVSLDSLVRIVNLYPESMNLKINYYQDISSIKLEEIYISLLNVIRTKDPRLFKRIKKSEAYSILLVEFSTGESFFKLRRLNAVALFVIRYPFFSWQILLDRILK